MKQGIFKKHILSTEEIAEVEKLTDLCNSYEGLRMRLSPEMLRSRPGNEYNDFLYYKDDALVGYLCLDSYGKAEKELVAMVHPEHRRKGIFQQLLDMTKRACRDRGIGRLILICEQASPASAPVAEASGAVYDFAEHEMILTTLKARGSIDGRLHLQLASSEESDLLASVLAQSFGDTEEEARETVEILLKPHRQFYLVYLGEEPIGCINLDPGEKEIGIYAFGILPQYRRHGYGRQVLEKIIQKIQAESQTGIMLDVETDNTNAIGLYLSCGFAIRATYSYYNLDLP